MRYDLTELEWSIIEPLLPKNRAVKPKNNRRVLNGIFWVLRIGAPWRDIPERYGPYRPFSSSASRNICRFCSRRRRHGGAQPALTLYGMRKCAEFTLDRIAEPSATSDQPDHLEIVDVLRDDLFTIQSTKNGVRYAVVTLPKHEAWLTDSRRT